jgi:3'-phosphoadenosine 5'-phosphosulfate sulfotransferase (PAPS reductase)/FAD synthetase
MRKVIVNFSGGKDSTVAILEALKVYPKEEIILCWQDTGAEYLETAQHVSTIAEMLDLPLVVLRNEIDFWEDARKREHFPTVGGRFCTRDLKVHLFRRWVIDNRENLGDEIIVVSGIRNEESRYREALPEWSKHETSLVRGFEAWNWRPCKEMRKQDVINRIKSEGLPLHPCYDFSSRLSCWCCIFAPACEVRPYAEAHPELYEKACLLEDEIKHKWKQGFGFNDLMKQGRLL